MIDRDDDFVDAVVPKKRVNRRAVIRKGLIAGGVGYVAPMILGSATPVSAQHVSGDACGCSTPCNTVIPCNGNSACNCWVLYTDSACFCGSLAPNTCSSPCTTNADCPPTFACADTCCGKSCFGPCGALGIPDGDPLLPKATLPH